ncbi:twin-arginine translocase subunit TatC [Acidianus brierleyi]|uniref:Sec-independent protein translocase protein TatC n=1 Tax=Acidianus brierleyi TaxID=41673 RepID=A0A2U9IBM2_9CREN|nr:twin-arginine translocase subunit TatC [Acidianus brierleyi]AWR93408.1 twin-arginine translocase subunit TatC [Acidianus brierleyi]
MVARTEEIADQERPLLSHLRELALRLRRAFITLAIVFVILFAFDFRFITIYGYSIPIIYPNLFHSISTRLIVFFIHAELPPQLHLLNLNPFDTIYSSAYISFYFAFFVALPIIFKEIWGFISPGLYENERKLFRNIILPGITLFVAGSSFAYFIIVPFMMKFVLIFTQSLGVEPTLSLRAFISTLITLMLAVGLAFEFPLVMTILSYIGLVKAETWKKNWRWGVLGSFIIAWAISPGTTGGIIETTIGLILSALFFVGVAASSFAQKRRSASLELKQSLNSIKRNS